jgi:transcriptional regulator with XRE-family HTH domain
MSIPHTGLGNRQNFAMRPRQILSDNLKALMGARPDLDRLPKIVEASGKRLSNGTLDRIRRGASATDIDTLEELASTFGVEPWQLLVEGLNPQAVHVLSQIKALISTPHSGDTVNPDRMGKPASKAATNPKPKEHNGPTEPVFGPALTKLFTPKRGKGNGRRNTDAAPPAKRSGKRS